MSDTGWWVGGIVGLLALAALGSGADVPTDPTPPTATSAVPGQRIQQAPPVVNPLVGNPGGGHCGIGHNDDDVKAVVKAVPGYDINCP